MSARLFFRISAVLTLVFAAGHTYGFLGFRGTTPQALAVRSAMDTVRFAQGGSTFSFGGFYVGFGLYITAALALAAILTWWLGETTRRQPQFVAFPAVTLAGFHVVGTALSVAYFATPPAIFSAVIAVVTLAGVWRARRA